MNQSRSRHPLISLSEDLAQHCHSDRSEESRSASCRLDSSHSRARFLASVGMTELIRGEESGEGALGNQFRDSGNILMQGSVLGYRG